MRTFKKNPYVLWIKWKFVNLVILRVSCMWNLSLFFFQKKTHYAAYILYFERLVIIIEYHIFAFMRFVTANINVVKAQILDLVTIFVRSVGGLKSMYLTTMLFWTIGICRHASAASERETGLVIIKDDMSLSCASEASWSPNLQHSFCLSYGTMRLTFHCVFQEIIRPYVVFIRCKFKRARHINNKDAW